VLSRTRALGPHILGLCLVGNKNEGKKLVKLYIVCVEGFMHTYNYPFPLKCELFSCVCMLNCERCGKLLNFNNIRHIGCKISSQVNM
jgi:hypothetical protein